MNKKTFYFTILFIFVILLTQIAGFTILTNILKKPLNPTSKIIESSSTANVQWNSTWGGESDDKGYGIVFDGSDNIYITGYTGSYGEGSNDVFIACYSPSGIRQWNYTWGGGDNDVGLAMTIGESGNFYITGYTRSFGQGGNDAFIVCYNSLGTQQWNITWGGGLNDQGYDIILDQSGNIYLVGATYSFGAGIWDAFIACFNSSGTHQWNATWGGGNTDNGYGIALDENNNVYIVGNTRSFGEGESDVFIACYNSSGNQQWNSTWGGDNSDVANEIIYDGSNNIYITGRTESFGNGGEDVLILCYDLSGTRQWNTTWGDEYDNRGRAVCIDDSNNLYITGYTNTSVPEGNNALIACFNSLGTYQWDYTWGGQNDDQGITISKGTSEDFYITGYTKSFGAGEYDAFIVSYKHQSNVQTPNPSVPGYHSIIIISICVIMIIGILIDKRKI
ncbi:MAG: hypothetical protein EU547_00730 [Promethearchaeota archaeon]|nr:MAG: hypothetical protein EU547_00730 [Candidatus Lokiarchaeota archaeon]